MIAGGCTVCPSDSALQSLWVLVLGIPLSEIVPLFQTHSYRSQYWPRQLWLLQYNNSFTCFPNCTMTGDREVLDLLDPVGRPLKNSQTHLWPVHSGNKTIHILEVAPRLLSKLLRVYAISHTLPCVNYYIAIATLFTSLLSILLLVQHWVS